MLDVQPTLVRGHLYHETHKCSDCNSQQSTSTLLAVLNLKLQRHIWMFAIFPRLEMSSFWLSALLQEVCM